MPKKLKEVHNEGYACSLCVVCCTNAPTSYAIIIVTNQALRGANAIKDWKKKIALIGAAVGRVITASQHANRSYPAL